VIRLAPAKLDALLERSSELLMAVRTLGQPVAELDALRERVRGWGREVVELEHDPAFASPNVPAALRASLQQVCTRWREAEAELERLTARVGLHQHDLERLVEPLLDDVRRARMLPFSEACRGFDRLARDLARQAGKEVVLRIEGGGVELDRVVLEELKDPLRHLVRNAIDHGLETPAERRAAGKPEAGELHIGASLQGQRVAVVVRDDGRGVDRAAVAAEAERRGLPAPADDASLAALLFRPGFSTAHVVTEVSGRGVGLDVVRERVEAMHGTVALDTAGGRGAGFTLSVPLTLSGLRALLVRVGRGFFALPSAAVGGLLAVLRSEIALLEGREAVAWKGRHVPLVHLSSYLGVPSDSLDAAASLPAVVVVAGERAVVCVVDELVAESEITVRSLGPRLRHLSGLAGATLLSDGRVALILSATALLRAASEGKGPVALASSAADGLRPRPHVLLVEDSLTTRSLEKMILEAAGYRVTAAVDGRDALDRVDDLGVDLVVSDVQMPRVDGVELTRALRANPRFATLPVVLVTGLGTDVDRQRGLEAGANAYLVKSAFDQAELLATLEQLL
jgi:two-component system chemotaxis sensor kinase CheA